MKARLKQLAYSERYKRYKLEDIVSLEKGSFAPKKKKKTGEHKGTGGKVTTKRKYNLNDPDSIPWDGMSDKEFDEVSEKLAAGKGRLKITKRRK